MENFPMNPVDLAVVIVVVLAALLAFTRGFVAEVVSILTWIGSAAVAAYALPYALPIAQVYVKHDMLAYGAALAAVFVVSLVILSIAGNQLSQLVQRSRLSAVDRSLGFAFGLLKGGVIVSVAYLFFAWLVPPAEHPVWLKEARTLPLLQSGAGTIIDFVPENLRKEAINRTQLLRDKASAADDLTRLSTPVPATPKTDAKETDKGYNKTERGAINQLIQQNAGRTAPAN